MRQNEASLDVSNQFASCIVRVFGFKWHCHQPKNGPGVNCVMIFLNRVQCNPKINKIKTGNNTTKRVQPKRNVAPP